MSTNDSIQGRYARLTKSDIIEKLEATEKRLQESEARKDVEIERPAEVPEASALAACIRAIDRMQGSSRSSSNYGSVGYAYSDGYVRSQSTVERLLRSLAAKYDVPLIEVRTEPCHRAHIDEISHERLMSALGVIR